MKTDNTMRKRRPLIFSILWIFAVGYGDFNNVSAGQIYGSDKDFITRNMADEASHPFTIPGGYSLSKLPPRYKQSISKFPDVGSCLKEKEEDIGKFDVRTFEWSRLLSVEDIDVCVFRVLMSLESVDGGIKWFHQQGFDVNSFHYDASSETTVRLKGQKIQSYSASISTRTLFERLSWRWRLLAFHTPAVAMIQIQTTSNGYLLASIMNFNQK